MKKKTPSQGELFRGVDSPPAVIPNAPSEKTLLPAWREAPQMPQAPRVLTVTELTFQIKSTLETRFPRVIVRGEISGYRGPHPRGHLYFSLKDADCAIEARIWASMASRLKFKLKEGMAVVAEGSVDLYAQQGRYSLIIQKIEPEGVGALALAFEQLKEKLSKEGLMGPQRKRAPRPLPYLPRRIGVVTSLSGAALRDFLRVLHNRHPGLSVLICDARMQGDGSAREVVSAIEKLSHTDIDVLVVTRGGGSIEDLWTFNEESVARAIFACPVPVVSAIGHEVDFTIADFVADFRAPTPSAAAERMAPVLRELEIQLATHATRLNRAVERVVLERHRQLVVFSSKLADPRRQLGQHRLHLSNLSDELAQAMQRKLKADSQRFRALAERLARCQPQAQLARIRERLSQQKSRMLENSPRHRLRQEKLRLEALKRRVFSSVQPLKDSHRARLLTQVARLEALSPLAVMARGFSLTFLSDGRMVRRADEVAVGEMISVKLAPQPIAQIEQADILEARVISKRTGA